jgi:hypothetical protein
MPYQLRSEAGVRFRHPLFCLCQGRIDSGASFGEPFYLLDVAARLLCLGKFGVVEGADAVKSFYADQLAYTLWKAYGEL